MGSELTLLTGQLHRRVSTPHGWQACCIDVFERPKLIVQLGETPAKRRFVLGRKARIVLYETGLLGSSRSQRWPHATAGV